MIIEVMIEVIYEGKFKWYLNNCNLIIIFIIKLELLQVSVVLMNVVN